MDSDTGDVTRRSSEADFSRNSESDMSSLVRCMSSPSPVRSQRPSTLRPKCSCPVYGVRASVGRRARMEDAVSIVENFLEVPRPRQFWRNDMAAAETNGSSPVKRISKDSNEKELCHFFGVYDGHNGPYAAHHCRGRLHENLRSAFYDMCSGADSDTEPVAVAVDLSITAESGGQAGGNDFSSPSDGSSLNDRQSGQVSSELDVYLEAFRRTDRQFSEYQCAERVGTTALTALVGSRHITIGSCGKTTPVNGYIVGVPCRGLPCGYVPVGQSNSDVEGSQARHRTREGDSSIECWM